MAENEKLYGYPMDDDHLNFTQYMKILMLDESSAGNPEITAISQVFECPIEVYEKSKPSKIFVSENFNGNTNKLFDFILYITIIVPVGQMEMEAKCSISK